MPKCEKIRRKHRQICIGDLDKFIEIQTRSLDDSLNTEAETEAFTTVLSLDSMLETVKGIFVVDLVNGGDIEATHRFTIRLPDIAISGENWILFKEKRYSILNQENFEELDEFLQLLCVQKGSTSRNAASA